MKMKTAAPFLVLFVLAANSAWAQVQMNTISIPATVANPLTSGLTVNFTMTGSKYGVGAAAAQVTFYLATSPTATTFYQLDSRQILLNGSGLGPYYPPGGTQTWYISASSSSNASALFQSIAASCQPQTWYVLGRVDYTPLRSSGASQMGTPKQPDFYFTAGTITPNSIQPGGTTNISFSLYTACPANNPSTVGIYLADASYQPIGYIGGVSIGTGAGTFSLPPTPITFSSAIAPGNYTIVLIADENGVVPESNENNNGGAFNLTITSPLRAVDSDAGEEQLNTELPVEFSPELYDPRMGSAEDAIFQAF